MSRTTKCQNREIINNANSDRNPRKLNVKSTKCQSEKFKTKIESEKAKETKINRKKCEKYFRSRKTGQCLRLKSQMRTGRA